MDEALRYEIKFDNDKCIVFIGAFLVGIEGDSYNIELTRMQGWPRRDTEHWQKIAA
ncbi:hypothetical protein [Pseudomonas sp. MPB26]|uniref:hypothetical protein n=1 Tax=Pseudomonas sp. MPB26 TaxID=3388491 RepID=UPI003985266D